MDLFAKLAVESDAGASSDRSRSRPSLRDLLAIPSGSYALSGANVDALIDTLTKDLFTPDPFVVRPG